MTLSGSADRLVESRGHGTRRNAAAVRRRMSRVTAPTRRGEPLDSAESKLAFGRGVVRAEREALDDVLARLDERFVAAVDLIHQCRGNVIVTGMGKAGNIAQKIAATLASTGTSAHAIHPADALHGDLGRIQASDVVMMLSFRGRTKEMTALVDPIRLIGAKIIAITATSRSPLGEHSDVTIEMGDLTEACPHQLAPTSSTTAMLALGDAVAMTVSRMRGFSSEEFALRHPAGSLGRRLMRVEQVMRRGKDLRLARQDQTVRDVFGATPLPRRRTGAVMVIDACGAMAGLFTDSDLARLFQDKREADALDGPIADVMVTDPTTIRPEQLVSEALHLMHERKFSEIPVLDAERRPVGLVDITDLIGLGFATDEE